MLIHNREDYADNDYLFTALPGYTVNMYLTPSIVKSDENVRTLRPSERNCLFQDEVKYAKFITIEWEIDSMDYFQKKLLINNKYSYASCMTDCRVRGYIDHCECIPFFYPHTGT